MVFCWGLSSPTPRTVGRVQLAELQRSQCSCRCGDPSLKIQMEIQVNKVDQSVFTSCVRRSQQLLEVPFEYRKLPASGWFQAQLQFEKSEGACLVRQRFLWISLDLRTVGPARLKQFLVILKSNVDALQFPRNGFRFPEWTFLNWVPLFSFFKSGF